MYDKYASLSRRVAQNSSRFGKHNALMNYTRNYGKYVKWGELFLLSGDIPPLAVLKVFENMRDWNFQRIYRSLILYLRTTG